MNSTSFNSISLARALCCVILLCTPLARASQHPETDSLQLAAPKFATAGQSFASLAPINELELSYLLGARQNYLRPRSRRHISSKVFNNNNNNNKPAGELLQPNLSGRTPSQTIDQLDEIELRRQLPDLIAQAQQDKNLERALLKLLLRSAANNMGLASGYEASNTIGTSNLLSNFKSASSALQQQQQQQQQEEADLNADALARMNLRLNGEREQGLNVIGSDYASIDPSANSLADSLTLQSGATFVDKREYMKPCLFNAASCVRSTARKSV